MIKDWKSVKNLPYHYGVYLRGYGGEPVRHHIKLNYDSQKYSYNHFVAVGLCYYRTSRFCNPKRPTWYQYIHPEWSRQQMAYATVIRNYGENKKEFRRQHWFLNQQGVDSTTTYNAYSNYQRAWSNFKKNVQSHVPVFHKKNRYNYWYDTSCNYHTNKKDIYHVGSIKIMSRKLIKLPKLKKPMRISKVPLKIWNMYRNHDIRIGSVKITDDNTNQIYVSLQLASDKPFRKLGKTSDKLAALGYDLNTSNYLVCTDRQVGNNGFIANPRYYEHEEHHYKKLQRCLSRKYRRNHRMHRNLLDCRNYQRNRIKLALTAKHVKNQRFDFLQRLSTKLIKSHDFLVGENLKSKNMLRNHRIAKSIQSVGWREFISMLEYKAKMYHKIYILVNPAYTTQMCSNCGYICNKKDGTYIKLGVEKWTCPKCHHKNVRDRNASVNILNKGLEKILPYLPKSYYKIKTIKSLTVRMATSGHQLGKEKVLLLSHKWLKYLVTHYYGAIDSSRLDSTALEAR